MKTSVIPVLGIGVIVLYSCPAFTQSDYFETSFGTAFQDYARSVRQLSDGSIYVAGYSNGGNYGGYDFALHKLSRYGNLIWTKYYGDSLDNNGLYLNLCPDGNLIFAGETQTPDSLLDVRLYKLDTAGNVLWAKQYSTAGNESVKYVAPSSDGGYILAGFQSDAFASNDIYVIKTNSAGSLQWQKAMGGTDNDYADMVRETPEGDFIITADTKSKGAGGYDVEVIKLNSAGTVVWDSVYGDSLSNGCQGILVTSKNKYLSYGETEVFPFSPFDFYLLLVDTNGNTIWQKTFGGTKTDAVFSVRETPDGGFLCTGYSSSYAPGPIDLIVLKTDSLGNLQWARNYGGGGIDIGYDIYPSFYNGYLVTGKTFTSDDECYLLHLDTAGLVTGYGYTGIHRYPEINVYPNPSSGSFTFSSPAGTVGRIEIYNGYGEMIYSGTMNKESETIYMEQAKRGIYFYKITARTGKNAAGKLMVE